MVKEHPKVDFNVFEVARLWEIKMLLILRDEASKQKGLTIEEEAEDEELSEMDEHLGEKFAELAEFYGVSLDCYNALRKRWDGK